MPEAIALIVTYDTDKGASMPCICQQGNPCTNCRNGLDHIHCQHCEGPYPIRGPLETPEYYRSAEVTDYNTCTCGLTFDTLGQAQEHIRDTSHRFAKMKIYKLRDPQTLERLRARKGGNHAD